MSRQTKEDIANAKDRFIFYFQDVPVQKYAAMYIGRTEQTIINWMKEDEDFFNRVQTARAEWIKKKAIKVRAEFALERLEKDIWAERKTIDVEDKRKDVLAEYGIGDDNGGQADGSVEGSSENTA